MITTEELMEMLGLIVFIGALRGYAHTQYARDRAPADIKDGAERGEAPAQGSPSSE
jgi:hypothetical protein